MLTSGIFSLAVAALYSHVTGIMAAPNAQVVSQSSFPTSLVNTFHYQAAVPGSQLQQQHPLLPQSVAEANRTAYIRRGRNFWSQDMSLWAIARASLTEAEGQEMILSTGLEDETPILLEINKLAHLKRDECIAQRAMSKASERRDEGISSTGIEGCEDLVNLMNEVLGDELPLPLDPDRWHAWKLILWLLEEQNIVIERKVFDSVMQNVAHIIPLILRLAVLEEVYISHGGQQVKDVIEDVTSIYIYLFEYLTSLKKYFTTTHVKSRAVFEMASEIPSFPSSIQLLVDLIDGKQNLIRQRMITSIEIVDTSSNAKDSEESAQLAKNLRDFDQCPTQRECQRITQLLEEYYAKILNVSDSADTVIAESVNRWLLATYAFKPHEDIALKSSEFQVAVSMTLPAEVGSVTREKVLKVCKGLVVYEDELDAFVFAHPSVSSVIQQWPKYASRVCHAYAAEGCLASLVATQSAKNPLGHLTTTHQMDVVGSLRPNVEFQSHSFEAYARQNWIKHCKEAGEEERSSGSLRIVLEFFLFSEQLPGYSTPLDDWIHWFSRQPALSKVKSVRWNIRDIMNQVSSRLGRVFMFACDVEFLDLVRSIVPHADIDQQVLDSMWELLWRSQSPIPLLNLLFGSEGKFEVTEHNWNQLLKLILHQYPEENAVALVEYLFELHPEGIVSLESLFDRFSGGAWDLPRAFELLLDSVNRAHLPRELSSWLLWHFHARPKMFRILLDHIPGFVATERMLINAIQSMSPETFSMLIEYGGKEALTADVVQAFFSDPIMSMRMSKEHDMSMVKLLLDSVGKDVITEDMLASSLSQWSSDCFSLLLNKTGPDVLRSEQIIVAGLGADNVPDEIQALIMDPASNIPVTEDMLSALLSWGGEMGPQKTELFNSMLLRIPQITEDLMSRAAERNNPETVSMLLDQGGVITENVLIAALQRLPSAQNIIEYLQARLPDLEMLNDPWHLLELCIQGSLFHFRRDTIRYLLQCVPGDTVPAHIIDLILKHTKPPSAPERYQDMRPAEKLLTINVFLESSKTFTITLGLLNLALRHAEKMDTITRLYGRTNGTILLNETLAAAVANEQFGDELLAFFVPEAGGSGHILITEELLTAAAGNHNHGERLLHFLKIIDSSIIITPLVLEAAARTGTLKVFSSLVTESPSTKVTKSVLLAALETEHNGKEKTELITSRFPPEQLTSQLLHEAIQKNLSWTQGFSVLASKVSPTHISASMLLDAVNNMYINTAMDIVGLLLGMHVPAEITEEVLEAAINKTSGRGFSAMTPIIKDYKEYRRSAEPWMLTPKLVLAALRGGIDARRDLIDGFVEAGLEVTISNGVVQQLVEEGNVDALVFLRENKEISAGVEDLEQMIVVAKEHRKTRRAGQNR